MLVGWNQWNPVVDEMDGQVKVSGRSQAWGSPLWVRMEAMSLVWGRRIRNWA